MHFPVSLQIVGLLCVFFGSISAHRSGGGGGCSGGCSGGGSTIIGPSDPGATIQGPGSQANIIGPDGGRISAYEVGGKIYVPPKQGGIIQASYSPGYVSTGGSGYSGGSSGGNGAPGRRFIRGQVQGVEAAVEEALLGRFTQVKSKLPINLKLVSTLFSQGGVAVELKGKSIRGASAPAQPANGSPTTGRSNLMTVSIMEKGATQPKQGQERELIQARGLMVDAIVAANNS
ncbi:hypothetical protein D910_10185 [Dendroctonus ponderosae]|uniref:DUF4766 domain-containing protein n=1 Tax=Dendroctonus ponderosae TaxID=77166 RepID=U4UFZ5_DENPD|nr:hypothetical protein D910_10185 [Dendroctonus ponderosae]